MSISRVDLLAFSIMVAGGFVFWLSRRCIERYRCRLFPDLLLLDQKDLVVVWDTANGHSQMTGWTFALAVCVFVIYLYGRLPLYVLCHVRTPAGAELVKSILLATMLGLSPLIRYLVLRGRIGAAIRIQLAQRGMCLCVKCGYDLRGATRSECSECGFPYPLSACTDCLGRGTISRMHYLIVGFVCTATSGIMLLLANSLLPGRPPSQIRQLTHIYYATYPEFWFSSNLVV